MLLPNTLVNYYFEEICKIPHISYHEEAIADYIVSIANKYHHYANKDKYNNVVVIMEASEGYEDKEAFMFQAHIDMVGTKSKDSNFDFLKDSLKLKLNNNILTAENTTLGADDGVGVAIMLAFMANDSLKHPRLELLFTSCEEVGTIGASKMDISKTIGKQMINLDGQGEEDITVGCYCSDKVIISKNLDIIQEDTACFTFHVQGFEAYDNKRVHPLKVMLSVIEPYFNDINFVSLNCGIAENMPATELSFTIKTKSDIANRIQEEFSKDYHVSIESSKSNYYYNSNINTLIKNLIEQIKEGILMSSKEQGMISIFMLGIMRIVNNKLEVIGSYRCLNDDIKKKTEQIYKDIAIKNNCDFETSLRYKSWPYNKNSKLKKAYTALLYKERKITPKEVICPGGLEVTDFLDKRKELDILSLGVNCGNFHSTNEYLEIDSLNRMYDLLCKLINA